MKTLVINENFEHHINSENVCDLRICLKKVYQKVLEHNLNVDSVKSALRDRHKNSCDSYDSCPKVKLKANFPTILNQNNNISLKSVIRRRFVQSLCSLLVLIIAIYVKRWDHLMSSRCAIANNYFVMEMTRPPTDCSICRNVNSFVILDRPTKAEFARHAYTGHPILVRGSTDHWSARNTFSFDFFRRIYTEIPDAYESVENECQFFPFKTEFSRLSEVFSMPEERVRMSGHNWKTWYIGW